MSHCHYVKCETCGGEYCARGCAYDNCKCGKTPEEPAPLPPPPRVEPNMHGSRAFERIMDLASVLPIDPEADRRVGEMLAKVRSRSPGRKLVAFSDAELDILEWNYETCQNDLKSFGMIGDSWAEYMTKSIALFERVLRMYGRITP